MRGNRGPVRKISVNSSECSKYNEFFKKRLDDFANNDYLE